MKFSFTALAFSLVIVGTSAHESNMAEIRSKRRLSKQFMDAMRQPSIEAARKKGRAQQIRKLHQDLMHASRKLANNQYDQYAQQAYNQQQQYSEQQQQWYGEYADQQQQGQDQQQQQGQYGQYGGQQQYAGQYDGQQYAQDNWAEYYEWDENSVPFDLTSRSFKYAGCAAIKTYDEERAEETGNPMVIDTYAVFRLCPASSCNEYSLTGCGKNYGEYAIEMNNYLTYILNYYDSVYEQYCEYCEACDYEYQAEVKTALQTCYQDVQQMQWMQQQEQDGGNSYQDYYNQNGNDNGNANGNGNVNYQAQYANNGNANYNANVNYNGNANANYQAYANQQQQQQGDNANDADANGNNGGRKLQNYGQNYGYGGQGQAQGGNNYYGNGGQQNQQQMEQNANAYGYYNQNGEWVEGQGGANAVTGYWGQDGNYYPYDGNMQNMYTAMYQCQDGSMCDFCSWQMEQQYMTCDDYVCGDYYTYCSDLYGEQDDAFDPRDYLECQAYDNQYGQRYYIGPHCGDDHFTVSLGVFSDENCVNFIGESVSLSSILGYSYDDSDIFHLPRECISCDGAEEYAEQQEENDQEGRYGDYVSSPEVTEDGVVAMCFALYEGSAQCNMNMNNFNTISRYMSQYELDQEQRYCAFIKNIISGSYDETGEVILKAQEFDFADWRNIEQYKKLRMPASQAIGLALSIILCVALAATAAFTARALSRQSTPWRPTNRNEPGKMSRQNSGIVMGRSRSGPGAAPLI